MKAKARKTQGGWQVEAPALPGFGDGEELEVLYLREGLLMLARPGILEEMKEKGQKEAGPQEKRKESPAAGAPAAAASSSPSPTKPRILSSTEAALVRRLTAIRFEERTVPSVAKKISVLEKKMLDGLVGRRLIEVFKNPKYKEGVYNISRELFNAVSMPEEEEKGAHAGGSGQAGAESGAAEKEKNRMGVAEKENGITKAAARTDIPFPVPTSRVSFQSQDAKVPLNSPLHLAKFGYMVLDSENEARAVMEGVKDVQKSDPVKGVRGFDRKYYVLRRSFMAQNQAKMLQRLEQGDANAETVSKDTGLSPTAVQVLLMILADDGEVLEKKRGMWGRA
ncbi:Uncharacterised protein [uncultured archaeon]|nr:Uncharacterised protein [uncultured archaeon]